MPFNDDSVKLLLLAVITVLNILSYFLYYSDKQKAKKRQPRISEKTLLLTAFLFGGLGAWLGMKQFRHKTKQLKFKLFVPIFALLTVGAIYFILNMA